jgi:hypothetical protein
LLYSTLSSQGNDKGIIFGPLRASQLEANKPSILAKQAMLAGKPSVSKDPQELSMNGQGTERLQEHIAAAHVLENSHNGDWL